MAYATPKFRSLGVSLMPFIINVFSLGEFDLLLSNLRKKVRVKMGQKVEAKLAIMDSQSVRWSNNRSLNSIDGDKKVKRGKRHVVVD